MKKIFLLLLVAFFSVQNNYGQDLGPPPPGCECCAELPAEQQAACFNNCMESGTDDYCNEAFPINSNILILFATAIALGGYFFSKNHKKRPLKN